MMRLTAPFILPIQSASNMRRRQTTPSRWNASMCSSVMGLSGSRFMSRSCEEVFELRGARRGAVHVAVGAQQNGFGPVEGHHREIGGRGGRSRTEQRGAGGAASGI